MATFTFEAINENGTSIKDSIDAESLDVARQKVSLRGLIPVKIKETRHGDNSAGFISDLNVRLTPVTPPDLILFTKQFRTMLKAGVSILNLLQIMENQTENIKLKKIITEMGQDIREGKSLNEAFRKHPKVFSELYCSMIEAGEISGSLPMVMDRLIYIIDHEHQVTSDIKSALRYPLFILAVLGVAFVVLLMFVIPKFINIFERVGLDIPLPTQICMMLYQFMSSYWYLIIGGTVAAIVGLYFYFKTEPGRFIRDATLMRIPIVGKLMVKAAMSRFASIFSILQASGVTVLDGMDILSKTIGNAAITREFELIKEKLKAGRGISEPLKTAHYFPPMVINMVAIGEESGSLEEMLSEISDHYDSEVEYATKQLSEAIGPILTVGLAVVVGFFAMAIFLPMWDLTKMVH